VVFSDNQLFEIRISLYVFVVTHSYSEFTANLQHFRNTPKYDITVRRQFAFPSHDYERVDGYFSSKYISPAALF
ncbi:hypothetical protein, partial [uncultured Duncaniella sp.]|uniref:hypothetical protein n=1 Tax=uncultured Duncaniella sp. TaxID=2768039 RepID=UPI0025AFCCC3